MFKEEFVGDGIIALNAKSYYCWGGVSKYSCKGVQKSTTITKDIYRRVLESKKSEKFMNKGFVFKLNSMNSYELCKIGLTYLYGKRKVNDDGVSTLPIDF